MKIAIPILGSRVSPRFDFSPEVWIIDVERGEVMGKKNYNDSSQSLPASGADRLKRGGSSHLRRN